MANVIRMNYKDGPPWVGGNIRTKPDEEPTTAKVDALLEELDKVARSYEQYEFGLPTHEGPYGEPLASLRAVVYRWWRSHEQAREQARGGATARPEGVQVESGSPLSGGEADAQADTEQDRAPDQTEGER